MTDTVGKDGAGTLPEGSSELENTGERYLPGAEGTAEQAYDHVSRYRLAERYIRGREILDMGCGAGYGSYLMSGAARGVTGVDLSEEAVAYAAGHYQVPNLRYGTADVTSLPYRDGTFEAIVSFEVIEHIPEPERQVVEAKRVLADDGLFIVSTPDKHTYANERVASNPHHLKEMYVPEFREMLERHFEHVQLYYQGAISGSIITPDRDRLPEAGRAEMESAQFSFADPRFGQESPKCLYVIAVCTNGEPPEPLEHPLMILDRDRQIYEEHLDWDVLMRQMDWFHAHRHNMQQWRLRQRDNRIRQQENRLRQQENKLKQQENRLRQQENKLKQRDQQQRQLKHVQNQFDALQNSRALRLSRKVRSVAARLRGAARRER